MTGRQCRVAVIAVVLTGALDHLEGEGRGVQGSIAFFSARDGNNEIYVMDSEGKRPFRLTDNPASDMDPDVSPNGRDVVFTSNRTGNNEIYIMGRTGRNPVNLTNHAANDGWARWAPDGEHIVFHSNRDGNFDLYVTTRDGRLRTRLTNYPGIDQFPEWSPNGRYVAFRRDIDIHVLEVRSGDVRRLTDAPPLNQMPSWSPNGKQLAFMSMRAGYASVFLMGADGSNPTNLTPKNAGDADSDWISRAPSWSSTGREIYFMSSRPATGLDTEIFVVNADGTGSRRLTNTIGIDGSPRSR